MYARGDDERGDLRGDFRGDFCWRSLDSPPPRLVESMLSFGIATVERTNGFASSCIRSQCVRALYAPSDSFFIFCRHDNYATRSEDNGASPKGLFVCCWFIAFSTQK